MDDILGPLGELHAHFTTTTEHTVNHWEGFEGFTTTTEHTVNHWEGFEGFATTTAQTHSESLGRV